MTIKVSHLMSHKGAIHLRVWDKGMWPETQWNKGTNVYVFFDPRRILRQLEGAYSWRHVQLMGWEFRKIRQSVLIGFT